MARDTAPKKSVFRCVEAFAIFTNGHPEVYSDGQEVMEGDPILKTHRSHFEDASLRVMRSRHVETATAAPGEARTVSTIQHRIRTAEGVSGDQEGR